MLDSRHPFFPTFRRLMSDAAARTPVYDLGTSGRFAKEVGLVRDLFDEAAYKAGGYRPEPGQCDFHCDIQDLAGIADGEAGCVISLSVLEHVVDPDRAVREIARILKPGGVAIVSVPFLAGYHGKSGRAVNPVHDRHAPRQVDSRHATYGDFWRMTHEGLALMFAQAGFSRVDVFPIDGRLLIALHLSGLYRAVAGLPFAARLMARFDRPALGRLTTMHYVRAEK